MFFSKGFLGNIETAVVKEAIDRYVARCIPLKDSRKRIKNAAKRAVERRKEFKPLKYTSPVTFKVCFASSTEASMACLFPMVKREDGRTVSSTLNDYLEALHMLTGLLTIASTEKDQVYR